jgi:hypothetical protein
MPPQQVLEPGPVDTNTQRVLYRTYVSPVRLPTVLGMLPESSLLYMSKYLHQQPYQLSHENATAATLYTEDSESET